MNNKLPNKPIQVNIKLEDTRPVACDCGAEVFMDCKHLRYLSALQSPSGQATILEVPVKVCMKCHRAYTLQDMLNGIAATDASKATGIVS